MKRFISMIGCLALTIVLFAACSASQPYHEYLQAYKQLWETDSFVVEKNSVANITEKIYDGVNTYAATMEEIYHLVRSEKGDMFIADITTDDNNGKPTSLKLYFRDDYLYSQNLDEANENFRTLYGNDYAMNIITEGIINFPKSVISQQSIEDMPEGRLLTFVLDSEKYYEYRFPQDDYAGKYGIYYEQPVCTVLLDGQGRIKKVTGHFHLETGGNSYEENPDNMVLLQDQDYTITFIQYGGVHLDFPEIDVTDFTEIEATNLNEFI